jgi:hypothetical protein
MSRTKGALGKKPRKARSEKAAQVTQPTSSQSSGAAEFKQPLPSEIVSLTAALDELDGDKKALTDSGKDWIDSLAELKGLDKKAFGWVRTIWKYMQKEPEKSAISIPHFLSYMADLKIAEAADAARGLEINGEPTEPDISQETTGAEAAWPDDQQVRSRLSIVPGSDAA